jgi:hypothetical protein
MEDTLEETPEDTLKDTLRLPPEDTSEDTIDPWRTSEEK